MNAAVAIIAGVLGGLPLLWSSTRRRLGRGNGDASGAYRAARICSVDVAVVPRARGPSGAPERRAPIRGGKQWQQTRGIACVEVVWVCRGGGTRSRRSRST